MIVDNTPIEPHALETGRRILVKREDLCSPFPGPSFSKIRGVVAHIGKLSAEHVGVLDTYHSKAGWAVSYVCHHLGKTAVNFWPKYKKDGDRDWATEGFPREQQNMARKYGAKMVAIPAGRSAILYHKARRYMRDKYPGSYLMPNALKLPETIEETAAEVLRSESYLPPEANLVISISSGTIAAGVLLGLKQIGRLPQYRVILHMGYARSQDAAARYIEQAAGAPVLAQAESAHFIDEGYGYTDDAGGIRVPFPCNAYYDAKAWRWLQHPGPAGERWLNDRPTLFWNIGD